MKWNLKPVSFVKSLAASVSALTMCIAPVAQGAAAANQKQLINQYLKETGLTTKKMTVGQFWGMVRHVYPPTLQKQMDTWVALNKNEMMPTVEATSFKDANGQEQVRLTLTKDGQTASLTFTGDEDVPMKFNAVPLNKKELLNYNRFNDLARKVSQQDPTLKKTLGQQSAVKANPVIKISEYKKLTPRQRAEYLIRLRLTMESAEKVLSFKAKKSAARETQDKIDYVLQVLFGQDAFAGALTGQRCIIAGYISKYGADDSCGSELQGRALNQDLRKQMGYTKADCGGGVACNPLVYGFNNGKAYCVPSNQIKYATKYCNSEKVSPLRKGTADFEKDKARIIQSYMKTMYGKDIELEFDKEGKIPEDQYLKVDGFLADLNEYVQFADKECAQAPLKDVATKRDDQASACHELRQRMFSLDIQANKPEPLPPPAPLPEPPTKTCEEEKPGSARDANGKCTCEATGNPDVREEDGKCVVAVVETGGQGDLPGGKEVAKAPVEDSCGFWCRNKNWIIPVGIGLLGLGLFWWLFKDRSKAKPPVYVPPAPVPEPTPSPSPTVTPAPTVPPAPCPSPNTVVNGVCTPPVVVPPPVITNETGTKPDQPGRAGGVR